MLMSKPKSKREKDKHVVAIPAAADAITTSFHPSSTTITNATVTAADGAYKDKWKSKLKEKTSSTATSKVIVA